jgi:hypothetical protein
MLRNHRTNIRWESGKRRTENGKEGAGAVGLQAFPNSHPIQEEAGKVLPMRQILIN